MDADLEKRARGLLKAAFDDAELLGARDRIEYNQPLTPVEKAAIRAITAALSAGQADARRYGRTVAMARDAWLKSDEARMLASDVSGPVGGVALRNRLEVAFIAGFDAASTYKNTGA